VGSIATLLRDAGATTATVPFPDLELARAAQRAIVVAEAYAYHEPDLTATPERYGPDVRAKFLGGKYIPASEYLRAQRIRSAIREQMDHLLDEADVVLMPAVPGAAPLLEDLSWVLRGARHAYRGLHTHFTFLANLTGLPSLVVPVGLSAEGLPLAVQLMGGRGRDAFLLDVGQALFDRVAAAAPTAA
jgi:aspartyl-tRNA(Asn)/glutamyl-tRNA(Gln) amidotransferase subunit A